MPLSFCNYFAATVTSHSNSTRVNIAYYEPKCHLQFVFTSSISRHATLLFNLGVSQDAMCVHDLACTFRELLGNALATRRDISCRLLHLPGV